LQDEPKIFEEGKDGDSIGLGEFSDGSVSEEDLHDDEETGLTKKERDRRKWRKRRNTLLDQRVAPEKISEEEKKEADQSVVRSSLINVALIALWYTCSLSISLVRFLPPFTVNLEMPSGLVARFLANTFTTVDLTPSASISITNGCLIKIASISSFLCSLQQHTCSYSSDLHLLCYISYLLFDLRIT